MSYRSFWLLHRKPSPKSLRLLMIVGAMQKGGGGGNYKLPPVRNGPITTCVWLDCALRYFAGASPYDIMAKYGISEKSVSESECAEVEAVNNLDEFIIEYPDSEEVQLLVSFRV